MIADCPFSACSASVEIIIEQAHPGDDETTRQRVPEHALEPRTAPDYGACPASLMALPLGEHEREHLEQASFGVAMWRAGVERKQREPGETEPAVPHSKAPHPERGTDRWFRAGHPGDNPRGESGPKGYQRMPVGYLPGVDMGGSVPPTVGEVRSVIERMQALAAEAQAAAQAAAGKFAEAEALAAWIRQETIDDVGHGYLMAGKQSCEEAVQRAHEAIDAAGHYGRTL